MNTPDHAIHYGTKSNPNPFEIDEVLDLDGVDEDSIVDLLVGTNEIGMLCHAIASDSEADIQSLIRILKVKAANIREQLARGN